MNEMKNTLVSGLPLLGLELSDETCDKLCAFGAAMVKQNEVMNLTGITDDKGVANLHLLDSLTVMAENDFCHAGVFRFFHENHVAFVINLNHAFIVAAIRH